MNVLIVGANTKMAKVFSVFANTFLLTEPNSRFYKELEDFNTIKSDTDIFCFFGGVKRFFELYKISKLKDIDIIFTNDKISMIAAFFVNILSKKNILLLSTSHNSYAWTNPKKVKMFARIIKVTTHGYISLSSHVTDLLIENKINPQKILTTVNPIEQNVFKVKNDYSLTDNVSITYVAVVYKGKGQDILLKAISLLKNKGISFTINFYGDIMEKTFYHELQTLIKNNELEDSVHFHGVIDNPELHNMLCETDIYVCPSEKEMSPYNVIEAKAAGLPIIASKVGGIPNIISDQYDGILVEPGSSNEFASALYKLICDKKLREYLGQNAHSSSEIKHSPEIIALLFKDFIKSLKD